MKIRDVTSGPPGTVAGNTQDHKTAGIKGKPGDFEESLNKERSGRQKERIALMLEAIEEQGKRMLDSLNLKELLAYKAEVKAFMEEVVEGMYKTAKSSSIDKRGRHKIYSLVKRINRELEELTKDMVGGQKDELIILERVDIIKGLLIDMYT